MLGTHLRMKFVNAANSRSIFILRATKQIVSAYICFICSIHLICRLAEYFLQVLTSTANMQMPQMVPRTNMKFSNLNLFNIASEFINIVLLRCRPVSSSDKQKKRKTNEDKPTFLPPEFVLKQSLNSVYWYKSILLPSILHRFEQLLLAEDLRQTLVKETGVGLLDRPAGGLILRISLRLHCLRFELFILRLHT